MCLLLAFFSLVYLGLDLLLVVLAADSGKKRVGGLPPLFLNPLRGFFFEEKLKNNKKEK